MLSLIDSIIKFNGFKRMPGSPNPLYRDESSSKEQYWLIVHGKPEFTPSIQAQWLEKCERFIGRKSVGNSINVLCCWKVDSFNSDVKRLAHRAEEDTYHFKKHVLLYKEDELVELKSLVKLYGLEDILTKWLTEPEFFDNYKSEFNDGGGHSLLYRISIKLSSIKIIVEKTENLRVLIDKIEERIENSKHSAELLEKRQIIDEFESSEDILRREPDEIYQSLLKVQEASNEN